MSVASGKAIIGCNIHIWSLFTMLSLY